MSRSFRYGQFHDGPDPLAAPFDVRRAVDEIGRSVLGGGSAQAALRQLLRRGLDGRTGLSDLQRRARQRARQLRRSGPLDGTLDEVRGLLDRAIGQERAELGTDPGDDARLRESQLDDVPKDTARAVRELASYDWRSPEAAATFAQLQDLLRREVLDSRFRGMKQALSSPDPAAMGRIKDMLAALNEMLERDSRGEHTQRDFDDFLTRFGDLFPENPKNLEELVDSLARRAAAAERMMASLSAQQREELANLAAQVLADLDLAREMDALTSALRARRPDLDWNGRQRIKGDSPLGMGDATSVLEELADLEEIDSSLGQDYPGARLDDIDEEAVRRALGRSAADELDALRRMERELEEQGYLSRTGNRLELTPKAVRRLGQTALRSIFAQLEAPRRGGHDERNAGMAGEHTGATRPWQFGDEQPLDVVRTVTNAIGRSRASSPVPARPSAAAPPSRDGAGARRPGVRLSVDDFEVVETERRTSAAVCLLVDMSYSMVLRDTFPAAKQTALALHALVTGQFPQDAVQIIGFSAFASVVNPVDLATLEADLVQGTNLQHALMLAGKFLDRHADADPVVLVVTDGEPTAHLVEGHPYFSYPPEPETIAATVAEVDRMTRRGATLNIFLLDDEPRLLAFVQEIARRNGGRVLSPSPDRLGQYVVSDYLSRRRESRPRRAG